jgi:CRISPR system Cascade subunit CasC
MFVQISFATDYSAALQNRDQSGHAKRAPYGDSMRQRISSQCFKSALRSEKMPFVRYDKDLGGLTSDTMYDLASSLDDGMSVRSRNILPRLILPRLQELFPDIDVKPYVTAAMGLFLGKAKGKGEDENEDESGGGEEKQVTAGKEEADPAPDEGSPPGQLKQSIVLGPREINAITEAIAEVIRQKISKKAFAIYASGKKAPKLIEEIQKAKSIFAPINAAVGSQAGFDGKLFGRFSNSSLADGVDACICVSHLLTVHPIQVAADYFTVMDQLSDGKGFAHGNSTELASGLFYGYIVIDIPQMKKNFPAATDKDIAKIVAWLIRAIYQVEPAAKRGSTAAFGSTHEMLVEIGRRMPRTLVAAYQAALQPSPHDVESLSEAAVRRLREEVVKMNKIAGKPEHQIWLSDVAEDVTGETFSAYEILAEKVAAILAPSAGA